MLPEQSSDPTANAYDYAKIVYRDKSYRMSGEPN